MKNSKLLITFVSVLILITAAVTSLHFITSAKLFASEVDRRFSFSQPSGFYARDVEVSFCVPKFLWADGISVRYTLDGNTPTQEAELYSEPLVLPSGDETRVYPLKAVLFNSEGDRISSVHSATYVTGKDVQLYTNSLLVSITSDSEGLFSEETGILHPMIPGQEYYDDWSAFKTFNCKQRGEDWIRNAHMEVFEPDGSLVVSQNIGLCVDGDHGSMLSYPYSLKVLADRDYDGEHTSFSYDFFRYSGKKGTLFPHRQSFNNLVFKNGGNEYNGGTRYPDQNGTMLRLSLCSRLAEERGYMVSGTRNALVFLNGELYSAAVLTDSYNASNTAAKTGLQKDLIEIIKGPEYYCTQEGGYDDLYYSWPEITDSPFPENKEEFEKLVSVDDMLEFYTYELLINNTDFPKKNYAIWRYRGADNGSPLSDGRFRFLINDVDCTYDFRYDDDSWVAYFKNIKQDGVLMGSLVQDEAMRGRFINILCDQLNSGIFSPQHLTETIDELNLEFGIMAHRFYTIEDELIRQSNVQNLKAAASSRQTEVEEYLAETFAPKHPYTLRVTAPRYGSLVHFSTTDVTAADGDFEGTYYGEYPLTLSCKTGEGISFSHWLINGRKITEEEVVLTASDIKNDAIEVELEVETPAARLSLAEICTDGPDSYVELVNAGSEAICLADYRLSNNHPSLFSEKLPDITLKPGECHAVSVDNSGLFRISEGETVYLSRGSLVADSLLIPSMAVGESIGRLGGTGELRYYINPVPGRLQ